MWVYLPFYHFKDSLEPMKVKRSTFAKQALHKRILIFLQLAETGSLAPQTKSKQYLFPLKVKNMRVRLKQSSEQCWKYY